MRESEVMAWEQARAEARRMVDEQRQIADELAEALQKAVPMTRHALMCNALLQRTRCSCGLVEMRALSKAALARYDASKGEKG